MVLTVTVCILPMLVEELMSTGVVTVPADATVADAVSKILDHDVGSVVVLNDGNPVGMVTESDALQGALETGRSLDSIPITELTHRSVITVAPGTTVRKVARKMAEHDIKKLPVMDGVELLGIITMTDIVWHLSDIRKEAASLDALRDRWESSDGV
jgi:CBS domain-containing protein